MLSTILWLFIGILVGLVVTGWLSDRQSATDKSLTPGLRLLPGDISWQNQSGNVRVYFPVTSSLVLSVVASLVLWLIGRFS